MRSVHIFLVLLYSSYSNFVLGVQAEPLGEGGNMHLENLPALLHIREVFQHSRVNLSPRSCNLIIWNQSELFFRIKIYIFLFHGCSV